MSASLRSPVHSSLFTSFLFPFFSTLGVPLSLVFRVQFCFTVYTLLDWNWLYSLDPTFSLGQWQGWVVTPSCRAAFGCCLL
ncbi:hypothetical protein PENSPDRAFT_170350 [Peniophora sp. CONT]|nr:hypothetical protein PENSPDRAFT_170350 [Peniophora sp. CONT]